MSFLDKGRAAGVHERSGGSRRLLSLAVGLVVLTALVVAGCGDSEESTSASETASSTITADSLSAEQKAIVEKAYFTVPDELPTVVVEALEVADKPVTPEMEEKAIECMKTPQCKTGTDGDLVVAITDSFGDIPWRAQARLENVLQILQYPEVGEIIYTNAHGDQQQAIADFQAAVAQEVDVITAYFDFASAMGAQIRKAEQAGIIVASYISELPSVGDGPTSALQYGQETSEVGVTMAETAIEAEGENGTAALLTGTPGNPTGEAWRPTAEAKLKEAGWKIAYKGDTNWTPAGELQAVSTIVAKGTPVDAVLYDNSGTGLIEGFQRAGEEVPGLVTWAAYNTLYQKWEELGKPDNMFSTESQAFCGRIVITAALQRLEGKEVPGNIQGTLPFVPLAQALPFVEPTLGLGPGFAPPSFAPIPVLEATIGE